MKYTNEIRQYVKLLEEQNKQDLILLDLPYQNDQLAPTLSKQTVDVHYNQLTKNYFKNMDKDPFFEAGAYLHNLWWENLKPESKNNKPSDRVLELIQKKYNTFSNFKKQFENIAVSIQGNGWCVLTKSGEITIIKNHKIRKDIALLIDMWEHSMIDYDFDKNKYIKSIWKIVNWDVVNSRL